MNTDNSQRPALNRSLSAFEFQRWYWLKTELVDFARRLGIRTAGKKELLTARIAAALDGRQFTEPATPERSGGQQLSGELTFTTLIPAGQRCSQVVRAWMVAQVGTGFRFDAAMRAFFAASDGTLTMQDALEHWHATRTPDEQEIDTQFEYNRFTRAWHKHYPDGTRHELLAAWRNYRSQPIDERGRV